MNDYHAADRTLLDLGKPPRVAGEPRSSMLAETDPPVALHPDDALAALVPADVVNDQIGAIVARAKQLKADNPGLSAPGAIILARSELRQQQIDQEKIRQSKVVKIVIEALPDAAGNVWIDVIPLGAEGRPVYGRIHNPFASGAAALDEVRDLIKEMQQ